MPYNIKSAKINIKLANITDNNFIFFEYKFADTISNKMIEI